MIIDIHHHFMKKGSDQAEGPRTAKVIIADLIHRAERSGKKTTMEDAMAYYADCVDDADGKKLIERMNGSGTDLTIMLASDDLYMGMSEEGCIDFNREVAQFADKHPGRLLAFASIDPRRKEAPALLKRCLDEFNMKGLKWHPDYGFFPDSEEALRVLKVADDYGVPLLSHCTRPFVPDGGKGYALPQRLIGAAKRFPYLQIIAAHSGLPAFWKDWLEVAKTYKNVHGDMALWAGMFAHAPYLAQYLREIIDTVGPDRMLYGTDSPMVDPVIRNKTYIEGLKSLVSANVGGVSFTQSEVNAILGGNAQRILRLG